MKISNTGSWAENGKYILEELERQAGCVSKNTADIADNTTKAAVMWLRINSIATIVGAVAGIGGALIAQLIIALIKK